MNINITITLNKKETVQDFTYKNTKVTALKGYYGGTVTYCFDCKTMARAISILRQIQKKGRFSKNYNSLHLSMSVLPVKYNVVMEAIYKKMRSVIYNKIEDYTHLRPRNRETGCEEIKIMNCFQLNYILSNRLQNNIRFLKEVDYLVKQIRQMIKEAKLSEVPVYPIQLTSYEYEELPQAKVSEFNGYRIGV